MDEIEWLRQECLVRKWPDKYAKRLVARAEKLSSRRPRAKAARTDSEKAAAKERARQQSAAWQKANPERYRELLRQWRVRNKAKRKAEEKARQVKKRETTKAELFRLQRGRCAICRGKLGADYHIDHIMPRALGGSNERSNLQLACSTCNISKGAKHPIDHARSLGRLC